jgi:hypothetical protein
MKTFDKQNPPKRLRISQLCLPEDGSFLIDVPNPTNCLLNNRLQNFNHFSRAQLAEYQVNMLKRWGDIVLTLSRSSDYSCTYKAKYNSRFRKYMRASQLGVSRSLAALGNND